jgi:hypothetical protein
MSDFTADWLARREPYDARARNRSVREAVAEFAAGYSALSIVDLACGTGSTLRAMMQLLPSHQRWRLVDNDLGLLLRAQRGPFPAGIVVATNPVDLLHDLEAALDGPVDLVTTSAFLDLVSAEWLERLVIEAAVRRLPVYAALSYDGRIVFDPADQFDNRVVAAFNRHQRTDKGFGVALGPDAAAAAIGGFERVGYDVTQGRSDWEIGLGDMFQLEVVSGFAAAVRETGELTPDEIASWLSRRNALVAERRASLRVGHIDFFARPMERR